MKWLLLALTFVSVSQALTNRQTLGKLPSQLSPEEIGEIYKKKRAHFEEWRRNPQKRELPKTLKTVKGCGISNPSSTGRNISSRVANGEDARPNEFPWEAIVMDDYGLQFGGVLISDTHVLTSGIAALGNYWYVALGVYDQRISEGVLLQETTVADIHWYYEMGYEYDLGVITLVQPVHISDHIRPICLPSYSDGEQTFVGETATITGWGHTYTSDNPGVLQKGESVVISNEDCATAFGQYQVDVVDSHICTALEGARTRANDEGGPLNYLRDGKYVLLGLIELVFGQPTLDLHLPSLYIRLPNNAVLNFITYITGIKIDP